MLRRDCHESRTVERVWPRSVNQQRIVPGHFEFDFETFRTTNPVTLHGLDLLRPVDMVQLGQQLIGIIRDFQEPLSNIAPLDHRIAAPATSLDNLLVGQHRLILGAPVNRRDALVGNALLHQPRKHPLFPAVIFRGAGGKLPIPVVTEAQQLELRTHVVDILVGPFGGRNVVLERRVLGGHTKRIPAHRLQHIETLHPLEPRNYVTNSVIAHMPHVQFPAGIGEHAQAVETVACGVFTDLESATLRPECLRLGFQRLGIVCVHRSCGLKTGKHTPELN